MSSIASPTTTSTPGQQASLFLWLSNRLLLNGIKVMADKHRLRLGLIIFLGVFIWAGLLMLSLNGFQFLRGLDFAGPVSMDVSSLLFGLFFLSVTGLSVFSSGLLLYGSLFSNPESHYLLASPAKADQVFAYKFREATIYSGWSFILLGTPLLLGFGIINKAGWLFYLFMPLYLVGFLILPASIGAIGCLLIVTAFAKRRKFILALILVAAMGVVVIWIASVASGAQQTSVSMAWLQKLVDHVKPTNNMAPGSWMTLGILSASRINNDISPLWKSGEMTLDIRGNLTDALYYLGLVWAYGLAAYLLTVFLAKLLYRKAFDLVASESSDRRKFGTTTSDRFVEGLLSWTDIHTRTFVLKDWRTFRRDVSQWSQVLILAGIALLYFTSIPKLPHSQYELPQRQLVAVLNISVVGLIMGTFTSRFVFPLMSLEGRNFWVLGLLPLKRDRLLLSKFAYAATFTTVIAVCLILLSEFMLAMPWPVIINHVIGMICVTVGLSAMAVGLGSVLVNLKETNPTKIASGFGGTINLLCSLGYVMLTVAATAVPGLFYFSFRGPSPTDVVTGKFFMLMGISILALLVLMFFFVWLPLRAGIRAFRKMEF